MHHNIRVGKEKEFSRSMSCPIVKRVVFSQPAFWELLNVRHAQAIVNLSHSIQDRRCSIGGSIIHHEDFHIAIVLIQK